MKIEIEKTCDACPEQYDVKIDGEQVGYIRLRHSQLTVECPDTGGEVVYAVTIGRRHEDNGCFKDEKQRSHYLGVALSKILQWKSNELDT